MGKQFINYLIQIRLGKFILKLILGTLLFLVVIFILMWLGEYLLRITKPLPPSRLGVTFSIHYAQNLGLDAQETYQQILTDLNVKLYRIPIYWDLIENNPDKFDFSVYDQLLDLAAKNQAQIVIATGYKVPRWPECFQPSWAEGLNSSEHEQRILRMMEATVRHFQSRPEVIAWQVENEPLFKFGPCQTLDPQFLASEVKLVRSIDSRPIILTDSGEVGPWVSLLQLSDLFGISLYRTTWHPIFGFFNYPQPPLFYKLRAEITKLFYNLPSRSVFVAELQAEPWAPGKPLPQTDLTEQTQIFSVKQLADNIHYAQQTRLGDIYLWGVEWWYWMKLHGHPEYWEYAKTLF